MNPRASRRKSSRQSLACRFARSARSSAASVAGRTSRRCAPVRGTGSHEHRARRPSEKRTRSGSTRGGRRTRKASLPLALTNLVGRDADVETLRRWLADPAARLITLVGPGGVGKTRLALELAQAAADEDTRRVVFVPLAALHDPAFLAPAIAEALGLPDVTASDLPRHARGACADRPTLVILDNFEQLLEAASLVTDLLAAVGTLSVLATSRAPLRLRGEREYVVGPLALNDSVDATSPADLAASPAVRLFVERVRNVHSEFRLTPANGATVAAICRRLDALPLALELAAAWMKTLPPTSSSGGSCRMC